MLSTNFVAGTAAVLSLIGTSAAAFNAAAKTNVAMYYGQGPNEGTLGLAHFCQASNSPDIIPLGFINYYLAQGNGFPGSNFGSSCGSAVYAGPGYNKVVNTKNNHLLSDCGTIRSGMATCQGLGKKMLLSLGGASATYKLTSDADAIGMADYLWGAFGPQNSTWKKQRPFDYNGKFNVIDGFDFDVEHTAAGEQKYYITMINRFQTLFAIYKKAVPTSKTFYISAAPMCAVKDPNMGDMILGAKFDMIFIQFYNNPVCAARTWVTANPKYATTRREIDSTFSYDKWVTAITASGSKSSAAKLFIGLPGSSSAAGSGYIKATEMKPLIQSYWCHKNFGGIMIWEAMYAEKNTEGNFYQAAKSVLNGFAAGTSSINCATVTTSKLSPTPTCGSGSCATTYTVKSGDTCSKIATTYKLTMAQFTALNPKWTNASCPTLQIGVVLCVKAGAACPKVRREPAVVEAQPTSAPRVRRHVHGHAHVHEHKL